MDDKRLMHILMLLRNQLGQGTKLEEGYISNPDWLCLAMACTPPGMTCKDADRLGQEWRFTSLTPVLNSNDRCHALDYEGKKTWGKEPNKKKETPLYFYPDEKRQTKRAKQFYLTRLGEQRAKELRKLVAKANTDYPRPWGSHSQLWLPGWEIAPKHDVNVMSHFKTSSWGREVTDWVKGETWQQKHGSVIEKVKAGTKLVLLHSIEGDVLYVRTPSGKEGFLNPQSFTHPLDETHDENGVELVHDK